VGAYVGEAEERAYAIAEQKRKAQERGFRGMSLQEMRRIIQDVLEDTGSCPRCSNRYDYCEWGY
jgi:hypothetical protein